MKEHIIKSQTSNYKIDYEKELNPQQLQVVLAPGGPLLVIAGAGSGKTRTLTYRVARLVESGASPYSIMLLTFTNKAARDMLSRVERLIKIDLKKLWGGTFHHVAGLFLRRFATQVGYKPNFTIIDREDAKEIIGEVSENKRTKYTRFPKPDVLIEILSIARNTMMHPSTVIERNYQLFQDITDDILSIFNVYQERKRPLNIMDFDDLLTNWHKIVNESQEALDFHRNVVRNILVDEYQDTNKLQSEIVEKIAGRDGNIMVVGDDAQSIYSFRGANFENIISFPERFSNCKIYKLEINYRSTPPILDLANSSISKNKKQFQKTLKPVAQTGTLPMVAVCNDENEQAKFVTQKILELSGQGESLNDIAVLYRAHHHSLELQIELTQANIQFQVRSGMRFFEQAHIKDVTSYLRSVVNNKDELAWKRILKHWPRIGPATAERIWQIVSATPEPLKELASDEIRRVLPKGVKLDDLAKILLDIEEYKDAPSQAIRAVIGSNYKDYLYSTYTNVVSRVEDIQRLADYALKFESIQDIVTELVLASNFAGQGSVGEENEEDTVILSTVHQAKGLEWKYVFVIWLCDGKFPDVRSIHRDETLEEERRLFYVSCTRAKRELYLVYPYLAQERSYLVTQKPSRFIEELDDSTHEQVLIKFEPE